MKRWSFGASLALTLAAGCGARSGLRDEPPRAPIDRTDAAIIVVTDARPDTGRPGCSDVRRRACAGPWTAGQTVPLDLDLRIVNRLRELKGDCTGAWLVVDGEQRSSAQPVTVIARLDAQGRLGAVQRLVPGVREITVAVEFLSGRAAAFANTDGGYGFERLDDPAFPNGGPLTPIDSGSGFSLAGSSDGMASPTGFSFFAEQVRALWGLERIAVDDTGRFRDRLVLPVPAEVGLRGTARYERVGADDGSYTVLWYDLDTNSRQALDYDAAEQPSAVEEFRRGGVGVLGAVATDDGLVDAWFDPQAPSRSIMFSFRNRVGGDRRVVMRPGTIPNPPPPFRMTFARGMLLSFIAGGTSSAPLLESLAYDYAQNAFAALPPIPTPSQTGVVRAATVADGALVVWASGSSVGATPYRCP